MPVTVLVVDDSKFDRIILKDMLENLGYMVVGEAENGKEAVKEYFKTMPDIVLMNLMMPVMNGIEAMTFILENDPSANIIVTSSSSEKKYVTEAIKNGAKDFLVIPIKEKKLIEAIENILSAK
ncbi:chemotaxis protein CheY [Marinitoga sp. 1135]|uniref:Response regulator containing CheY-like receiver domain and AraC-type DNA-binding domain n=1 Tax=Marinitoga piezophila (strain DSM 14283 / JCM 11233 / KA3) TaxID=443254 RepID=H2J5J3_MARPK|nr:MULTISPECIES: response regulator [Marinitoga]AEX86137.1 response regulator containing CheY-like receiver domain and AraC-type DNA-binding domain [Marinitoga piezophila KA3]APT76552.1 chemotaxis protein CheY [Marinitoga sp. 1137]NUU96321.1 chemotaxis protein CheY [Marinitoga sp. 1135]NUU98239.1 chemotaxis protein CheY [Marinitoga sp. 1138]